MEQVDYIKRLIISKGDYITRLSWYLIFLDKMNNSLFSLMRIFCNVISPKKQFHPNFDLKNMFVKNSEIEKLRTEQ